MYSFLKGKVFTWLRRSNLMHSTNAIKPSDRIERGVYMWDSYLWISWADIKVFCVSIIHYFMYTLEIPGGISCSESATTVNIWCLLVSCWQIGKDLIITLLCQIIFDSNKSTDSSFCEEYFPLTISCAFSIKTDNCLWYPRCSHR